MYVPSGFTTTVPLVGSVFPVTIIVSPSGSKSLEITVPDTGVSTSVVLVSSLATGGSLPEVGIGATSIVTVAVSQAIGLPASHTS